MSSIQLSYNSPARLCNLKMLLVSAIYSRLFKVVFLTKSAQLSWNYTAMSCLEVERKFDIFISSSRVVGRGRRRNVRTMKKARAKFNTVKSVNL